MGKIEKLVVLGVLFLIVVVLGVAQLYDPGQTHASYPADGDAPRVDVQERPSSPDPNTTRRNPAAGLDRLAPEPGLGGFDPGIGTDPGHEVADGPAGSGAAEVEPPAPVTSRGLVIDARGLEAALDPAFLLYRVRRGDNWDSIALRLYGDAQRAGLLRRANEGLDQPPVGEELWVPTEDDGLGDATVHLVAEDESLWVIARQHLGAGHRWSEIFEANRDVLTSPESLRPGMRLRIPAH